MRAEATREAKPARPRGPAAADWRAAVAPYVGPSAGRAIAQLVSTLGLLVLSLGLEYWLLGRSIWLSLALAPLSGGLLVRTFIIMHDCAHGSFLPWRRANEIVGCVTGVLTLTPFGQWRRDHALHHASSGDLDRRGHGDVDTLTVREYLGAVEPRAAAYRLIRHPREPAPRRADPSACSASGFRRARQGERAASSLERVGTNIGHRSRSAPRSSLLVGWNAVAHRLLPRHLFRGHGGRVAVLRAAPVRGYVLAEARQVGLRDGRDARQLAPRAAAPCCSGSRATSACITCTILARAFRTTSCSAATTRSRCFRRAGDHAARGVAALRLALWDEDRRRMVRFDEVTEPA